jgi:hypothetical protein
MLRELKKRNPNNLAALEDIHNAVTAAKREKLGGSTYVEVAIEKLHAKSRHRPVPGRPFPG